jgi:hypothetical protein
MFGGLEIDGGLRSHWLWIGAFTSNHMSLW